MNNNRVLLLAAGLLGATLAFAGEPEVKWVTNIAIAEDDGTGHEPFVLELSSDELGFKLQDLQIGESRAVVDDAGRNILITRTSDGYDFDVDGQSISMPALEGDGSLMQVADFSAGNVDVEIMGDGVHFLDSASSGITIIASSPIDDATQAGIRSLLQSAGRTETVTFVDASVAPAVHDATKSVHKIKVVKAEVNTTQ
jgi:hypothetical protein